MTIEEHIPLAKWTTFKIGGNARFFCIVSNVRELEEAYEFARLKKVEVLILGGGSNLLISDGGFPGLVIKMNILGKEILEAGEKIEISVGAGENWDEFVGWAVKRGFFGLENLSLIPGTVGAAPVQNIGAYGIEAGHYIKQVRVFDPKDMSMKVLSREHCIFNYRDSIFKHAEGEHLVITSVEFLLSKHPAINTKYKDVENFYQMHPNHPYTPQGLRDAVISIRTNKLPNVLKVGTAGSFFKNPVITKKHYEELVKKFGRELPSYPVNDQSVRLPLAWILDNICGIKGQQKGNVGTYKNQALVLVNYGGATYGEIDEFAETIERTVKEMTGIMIEREVRCVI